MGECGESRSHLVLPAPRWSAWVPPSGPDAASSN